MRASCVCGPGGSRTGGGADRQQVPAACGVTRDERGSARLNKTGQGKTRRSEAARVAGDLARLVMVMRVCRQSHTNGRVVGLRPVGRGLKGWRKGGSVGSEKIKLEGAHARNVVRPSEQEVSISVESACQRRLCSWTCPRRPRGVPHDFSPKARRTSSGQPRHTSPCLSRKARTGRLYPPAVCSR